MITKSRGRILTLLADAINVCKQSLDISLYPDGVRREEWEIHRTVLNYKFPPPCLHQKKHGRFTRGKWLSGMYMYSVPAFPCYLHITCHVWNIWMLVVRNHDWLPPPYSMLSNHLFPFLPSAWFSRPPTAQPYVFFFFMKIRTKCSTQPASQPSASHQLLHMDDWVLNDASPTRQAPGWWLTWYPRKVKSRLGVLPPPSDFFMACFLWNTSPFAPCTYVFRRCWHSPM